MEYKNNPHFCLLPFMALNTRPNGGVKPCSDVMNMPPIKKNTTEVSLLDSNNDYHNLTKENLESVWNGEFMRDFRLNRAAGKYSEFCKTCYQQEINGLESKRQTVIKKYYDANKHLVSEAVENNGYMKTMPVWWELRLSSICNESCRMCIPQTSSKMREEFSTYKDELPESIKQNTVISIKNFEKFGYLGDNANFIDQIYDNLPNIKYLELHGGEPTVDKNLWNVLEHIVTSGHSSHIHIHVHTNIHSLKKKHIELWNQFKTGWIGVSIDAYNEENEYIRYGSTWSKIEENLKLLNGLGQHWTKYITTTVMNYNCCTIHRLVDWYIEYSKQNNMHDLKWQCWTLTIPELMRPEHIPLSIREKSIPLIENLKGKHSKETDQYIDNVIKILKSKYVPLKSSFDEFLHYTKVLDKKRNQSCSEVFPHLREIL